MKNSDDGAPNRKCTVLGCGCLLSPFLLLLLLIVGSTGYNNFRLWRFEQHFAALSHPPQSKFIERKKAVGLFGNGNHCDFFVAELRSFSGSQHNIRNFYHPIRIIVPNRADDGF